MSGNNGQDPRKWKRGHTILLGILTLLIFGSVIFLPTYLLPRIHSFWISREPEAWEPLIAGTDLTKLYLVIPWIVVMVLLILTLLLISSGTTGKGIKGILVDSRNQMSLSRLQLVAWTTLIISAFLTLAM